MGANQLERTTPVLHISWSSAPGQAIVKRRLFQLDTRADPKITKIRLPLESA